MDVAVHVLPSLSLPIYIEVEDELVSCCSLVECGHMDTSGNSRRKENSP
jgi:hypothetical protein